MINFTNIKNASRVLALCSEEQKNKALLSIASALKANAELIECENKKDLELAEKNGLKQSMIARLVLKKEQVIAIADDVIKVSNLTDPIGEVVEEFTTRDGLEVVKKRVPLGVIGVIYEARPNVTVDVSVLCLKTGNACVLKGGKEARYTNELLVKIIKGAIKGILPEDSIMLLLDRSQTDELLKSKGYVDLIIPRGSKNLINYVTENSLVPVIETGAGVCHAYVHKSADLALAIKIIDNAKTSKPAVCNAVETVLIDREVIEEFAPILLNFAKEKGVNLYANKETSNYINATLIEEDGYSVEYNSLDLSVKVVNGIDDAISHIARHSTKHSETIISTEKAVIDKFYGGVDSACVYSNASTRFTDGGCFGMGAEIGISTQKLHARGPMGLKEITSYKYIIKGHGETR